jgi:demethoxyubiquinone hydroxylase (CLK1/Coq7/Cat5 family)
MGLTEVQELREIVRKFRDEELEHLDIAVEHEAKKVRNHFRRGRWTKMTT